MQAHDALLLLGRDLDVRQRISNQSSIIH